MKKEINPAVATVTIIVIVIVAAVVMFRAANGGVGNKAPGEVGNPGPFAPGGSANGKAQPPRH